MKGTKMDIYGGSLISVMIVSMASCVETNYKIAPDITSPAVTAETALETPIHNSDESKEHAMMMWQKQPGTPIYTAQGEPIGSLRFTPRVRVYERVGDWVKIDSEDDVWVKASDLVKDKPNNLLEAPDNAAPLPRVEIRQGREPD